MVHLVRLRGDLLESLTNRAGLSRGGQRAGRVVAVLHLVPHSAQRGAGAYLILGSVALHAAERRDELVREPGVLAGHQLLDGTDRFRRVLPHAPRRLGLQHDSAAQDVVDVPARREREERRPHDPGERVHRREDVEAVAAEHLAESACVGAPNVLLRCAGHGHALTATEQGARVVGFVDLANQPILVGADINRGVELGGALGPSEELSAEVVAIHRDAIRHGVDQVVGDLVLQELDRLVLHRDRRVLHHRRYVVGPLLQVGRRVVAEPDLRVGHRRRLVGGDAMHVRRVEPLRCHLLPRAGRVLEEIVEPLRDDLLARDRIEVDDSLLAEAVDLGQEPVAVLGHRLVDLRRVVTEPVRDVVLHGAVAHGRLESRRSQIRVESTIELLHLADLAAEVLEFGERRHA